MTPSGERRTATAPCARVRRPDRGRSWLAHAEAKRKGRHGRSTYAPAAEAPASTRLSASTRIVDVTRRACWPTLHADMSATPAIRRQGASAVVSKAIWAGRLAAMRLEASANPANAHRTISRETGASASLTRRGIVPALAKRFATGETVGLPRHAIDETKPHAKHAPQGTEPPPQCWTLTPWLRCACLS